MEAVYSIIFGGILILAVSQVMIDLFKSFLTDNNTSEDIATIISLKNNDMHSQVYRKYAHLYNSIKDYIKATNEIIDRGHSEDYNRNLRKAKEYLQENTSSFSRELKELAHEILNKTHEELSSDKLKEIKGKENLKRNFTIDHRPLLDRTDN